MRVRIFLSLSASVLVLSGAGAASAAETTESQAKSKMEDAGYAQVARLHEANMGEWMADAVKGGQPVKIVLYPDGRVALRQEVDIPPPQPAVTATSPAAPAAAAPSSTAKP